MRSQFLDAVKTVFNAEMALYKLSATEVISWCFARMAHSNSVVGSPVLSARDRRNLSEIVMQGRKVVQGLFKCTDIMSPMPRAIQRQQLQSTRLPQSQLFRTQPAANEHASDISDANSDCSGRTRSDALRQLGISITDAALQLDRNEKAAKTKYQRLMALPNVHQGIHFAAVVEEYGSMANVNVMIGEGKHKSVPLFILLYCCSTLAG